MPYFYPLLLYSFWVLSSIFPFDLRVTRVPFCCNDRKRSQNGFCCLSPPTSFLFLRSPLLCGKLSRGWQLHLKHQILIRQFFPHRLEDVYHDVDFTSFSWYYLKIDNPLQNLQRFGSSKRNLKRLSTVHSVRFYQKYCHFRNCASVASFWTLLSCFIHFPKLDIYQENWVEQNQS